MSSPAPSLKRTDTEPSDLADEQQERPALKRSRTLCDSLPHEDPDSSLPDTQPASPDEPDDDEPLSLVDDLIGHLRRQDIDECLTGKGDALGLGLYDQPVLLIVHDLRPNLSHQEQVVTLLLPANSVPVPHIRTLRWCEDNMPLDPSDADANQMQQVLDFILGNRKILPEKCPSDLIDLIGPSSDLIETHNPLENVATVRDLGGNFSTIDVIEFSRYCFAI